VQTLSETTPEPLSAELAPFVAQARARLAQATRGLDDEAVVERLEQVVAQTHIEASRLGLTLPRLDEVRALPIGDGQVVVVRAVEADDQG
jgi:hypothetical protein